MRIIDAFTEAWSCFPDNVFSLDAWRRYVARISPALTQLCLEDVKDYDFEQQVLPVLQAYATQQEKARHAHEAFVRHTQGIEARLSALGLPVEADLVLYLGMCCAAGWATELDGRPAVLLGLEKIVELDWQDDLSMQTLIFHELGHLWHFQHRTVPAFADASLWQLYTEGMAMYFEQRLVGDRHFFHQNKNDWFAWCEANRDSLFAE